MTKPYSDMYTQNHFTDLEQEHLDFLHTLQSFTDPYYKQSLNAPERKAWTVQYTGPFPLDNQRTSPTQVFHDEQTSSNNVKRHSKRHVVTITIYRQMTRYDAGVNEGIASNSRNHS